MSSTVIEKIYLSSLKFLVPLTPEEVYAAIVSEAVRLVGAEWGSVFLEREGELRRVYSSHPLLYKIRHRKRCFLYNAFKTRKPVVLKASEIEKVHPETKKLAVVSNVIIPLCYRNKSIGILSVLTKREENLTDEELKTLVLFGSMASLAIRKTQLYYEAKEALKKRDLFISMVAHELKTPVTTIYGYAQFLLDYKGQKKEIKTDWIDSIYAECSRLTFLIRDLLEVSKIQKGQLHYVFKECSLRNVINHVIDNFEFSYPKRKLDIKDTIKNEKALLIGDFDRLVQLFINLLDNAAKFSPIHTKIFLIMKESHGNYIVRIKDSGKGIAKNDLPRVFEGYFKGLGSSHEGLGLGLFLAKSIVKQHHGLIQMRSCLDNGTVVEIQLPKVKKMSLES